MIRTYLVLFGCAILLLFSSCDKKGEKIVGSNPVDFTVEEQKIIGDYLKTTIHKNEAAFNILQPNLYPEAHNYLQILLNTLINTPIVNHRTDYDWNISIIHDDSFRTAFILPGGHVYVYTGLLKFLGAEHELLSILAHEMYYVDTELMVQRIRAAFGGIVMGDLILGNEIEGLEKMVEEIPSLSFTSEEVMTADKYATDILCLFQYAPLGIKDVMEKGEASQLTVHWLDNRSCDEVIRIETLVNLTKDCALNGIKNEASYQEFVSNYLP